MARHYNVNKLIKAGRHRPTDSVRMAPGNVRTVSGRLLVGSEYSVCIVGS